MCPTAGNDVSARNPFVVIVRVVSMRITSVTVPNDVTVKNDFRFLAECISAAQSALMSSTSVENWTMFKLQSRECVLSVACGTSWNPIGLCGTLAKPNRTSLESQWNPVELCGTLLKPLYPDRTLWNPVEPDRTSQNR